MQIKLCGCNGDYAEKQRRPVDASELPRSTIVSRLNVGNLDRLVRLLLGLLLVGLAATSVTGAWGYIGIVLMLTGVAAYCPFYALVGFSTTSR
jgi:hypothetical protein